MKWFVATAQDACNSLVLNSKSVLYFRIVSNRSFTNFRDIRGPDCFVKENLLRCCAAESPHNV